MSNTNTAPPSRTVAVIVGGIVVVSILALVAVIASNSGDSATDEAEQAGLEQQRAVSVQGAHLPVLGAGADPAVGTQIPTVDGEDFAGEPVTIAPGGTPKLLAFLAHWCPHCQAEVPRLVEAMGGGDTIDGVPVLGVSTGTDESQPNYPPSAWLSGEGWSAPVIADDMGNHAAEAFGLSGFPFFVAVDADGNVVARTSGELSAEDVQALAAAASAT